MPMPKQGRKLYVMVAGVIKMLIGDFLGGTHRYTGHDVVRHNPPR